MNKVKIKIEDLFELPGSEIFNPDVFSFATSVSTDTRTIKKNSIFVALKGEKFNGHLFVKEAIAKGASAIIINKNFLKKLDETDTTIVTVKDTTKTYGDLAKIWRSRLNAKVVAISGSNGKTSTKEILATLLEEKFKVGKTLSNNNNHIGVPLTIFETNMQHDVLVLELGTNHFGEIAYTSQIAQPDYALITNIGESHLEYLNDLEGVADEKIALFGATSERGGEVFVNIDDPILKKRSRKLSNQTTYGFKAMPDIKGELLGLTNEGKTILSITYKNKQTKITIPLFGISNAVNFLAASAVALKLGLSFKDLKNGAAKISAVDKRLNVNAFGKCILINDTYNANPLSMKSAFEFLNKIGNSKRKIAVLGDMFELGDKSIQAHRELSQLIKKNKVNEIYLIGRHMKFLDEELQKINLKSVHFSGRSALEKYLQQLDTNNTVILVKGSRGMKMEDFVNVIEGNKI